METFVINTLNILNRNNVKNDNVFNQFNITDSNVKKWIETYNVYNPVILEKMFENKTWDDETGFITSFLDSYLETCEEQETNKEETLKLLSEEHTDRKFTGNFYEDIESLVNDLEDTL